MKNIKQLIEDYLVHNKLRKIDIIRRMPYKNEAKGLRRLNALMNNCEYNKSFLIQLAVAMDVEKSNIKQAIVFTEKELKRKQREEARKNFKPHIRLLHKNKKPSSLLPLMFLGVDYFKKIELPVAVYIGDLWQQLEKVKEVLTEYSEEKANNYSPFGEITGFRYYYEFEEYAEFTLDGEIIGYFSGRGEQPKIITQIGGKKIEGGIMGR